MQLRSRAVFAVMLVAVCIVPCFTQDAKKTDDVVRGSEESIVLTDTADDTAVESDVQPVFSVSSVLRLIGALAVVVVLLFFALRFMKRSPRFKVSDSPYLKVVGGVTVAPGKTLHIVTLVKKGYLLASSEAGLSLVAEIDDQELIDAMNLEAEKNADEPAGDFTALLGAFLPVFNKKKQKDFSHEPFLSGHRDRLNAAFRTDSEKTGGEET